MKELYLMKKDYRFTFGREEAHRVDEVLARGVQGKTYVAWVYYNVDWVDFTSDILEEVRLEKIAKPGTRKEAFDTYISTLSQEEREEWEHRRMGNARKSQCIRTRTMYAKNAFINNKARVSKGKLAWKNQGH